MSVIIFSNLIAGVSGLDKSVINTANLLSDGGQDVILLNCVGKNGGFASVDTKWPLNKNVCLLSLQALTVNGGADFSKKFVSSLSIKQPLLTANFNAHDVAVISQIDQLLTEDDCIIFTHPLQSILYKKALNGRVKRTLTMMQIHGNYAEETHNRKLLEGSLDVIDFIQVVSDSMRPAIKEITGFADGQLKYIPNVHFKTELTKKRDPEGAFVVSIIGSIQDRKNQIDAVRAIEEIDRSQNIILDIWGKPVRDYGKFLEKYVQNSSAADRIRMRGVGTEHEIYQETDLVLITSKHEGFGYTLVEAASHGIPCIAYDYEFGAKEFIQDGVNGYLLDMFDVDALAGRISELAQDTEKVSQLGGRALRTYQEIFSPSRILEMYKEVFPSGTRSVRSQILETTKRKGVEAVVPHTLKRETVAFLKRPVFDRIVFEADASIEFQSFKAIYNDGSSREVSFQKDNNFYTVILPLRDKKLRCTRKRYIMAGQSSEHGVVYIFNTTSKDATEVLSELTCEGQADNHEDLPLCGDNHYIDNRARRVKYHSFEVVRAVTDENSNRLNHTTDFLLHNGKWSPYLSYGGEFKKVNILYNSGKSATLTPPDYSYKDIVGMLLEIEEKYNLNEYSQGDIFVWNAARATVLENLMMAFGLWGEHFSNAKPVDPTYFGKKNLIESGVKKADRIVLEFPRKGWDDPKTRNLQRKKDIVVEYPQCFGYTSRSYVDGPVYPIHEFSTVSKRVTLATDQKYKTGFLEGIFKEHFGVNMCFKEVMDGRALKFKKENYYWKKVFEKIKFNEIIVPSAYWSAGIIAAAQEHEIKTIDLQYALITKLHPTMLCTKNAKYIPDHLIAWSSYWAGHASKYGESSIQKRDLPDLPPATDEYDYCMITQPRVQKQLDNFLFELSKRKKTKKIALCLHPDHDTKVYEETFAGGNLKNVDVIQGATLETINKSRFCIGGYSTSLFEAAYLGKSTYVVPVPGFEVVGDAIADGLFKVCHDIDDLVEFTPPDFSKEIF